MLPLTDDELTYSCTTAELHALSRVSDDRDALVLVAGLLRRSFAAAPDRRGYESAAPARDAAEDASADHDGDTGDAGDLDESVLPLRGRTAADWRPALERLAKRVCGGANAAASRWGIPGEDTWGIATRALLSSEAGARRLRTLLLRWSRAQHGIAR